MGSIGGRRLSSPVDSIRSTIQLRPPGVRISHISSVFICPVAFRSVCSIQVERGLDPRSWPIRPISSLLTVTLIWCFMVLPLSLVAFVWWRTVTVTVSSAEKWVVVLGLFQYPKVRRYLDTKRTMHRPGRNTFDSKERKTRPNVRGVRKEDKQELFIELVYFIWTEGESRISGRVPQAVIRRKFAPYGGRKWFWETVKRMLNDLAEVGVVAKEGGEYRVRLKKRFNCGTLADLYSYRIPQTIGTEIVRLSKGYEDETERDIVAMTRPSEFVALELAILKKLAKKSGIKNPDLAISAEMKKHEITEAWFLEGEVGPPIQPVFRIRDPDKHSH